MLNGLIKPTKEIILRSQLAEDSFIYSQTHARLIYNSGRTTVHFNGKDETIDGRAVLLSTDDTTSRLFAACCKNTEAHENYSLQLIDIFNHQNVIALTGNSFLCGDQFTDGNMCHAALDHLCRAWLSTKTNLKIENYIFYNTIWDWAKELIESLLPANSIQYIAPLQPVKCEKLFFLANSWSNGTLDAPFHRSGMIGMQLKHPACNANKQFLRTIRRKSIKLIRSSKQNIPKIEKIFISRKSKARLLPNQKEIEALFESYDFKTIYLEDLTTSQQRLHMVNAKFVAGLHGAGLTNLVACSPSTVVLELLGNQGTAAYAKMAHGLSLQYESENIVPNPQTTNKACLKTIERALQKMLLSPPHKLNS